MPDPDIKTFEGLPGHCEDASRPFTMKLADTLNRRARQARLPITFVAAPALPESLLGLLAHVDQSGAPDRSIWHDWIRSLEGSVLAVGLAPWRATCRVILPAEVEIVLQQIERRQVPVAARRRTLLEVWD
jgi:hypothetical protein